MDSIIVSHIPDICTRDDILQEVIAVVTAQDLDYILHPLGKDETRAVITLKNKRAAELLLRQQLQVFGATLKCRPAPRQTYQRCTAEVDPLTVASIPDLQVCIHSLQTDYGVDVAFGHDGGTMVLSGSLLQIQCAQTKLDAIYREQQEIQASELLLVEQDLTTPRSQRSLSIEQSDFRRTDMSSSNEPNFGKERSEPVRKSQEKVRRSQEPTVRAPSSSNMMLNTMPAGHMYEQRPKNSFDMNTAYKASTVSSSAKQVDDLFEQSRPTSSMSSTGGANKANKKVLGASSGSKSHRGLPQDVLPHGIFRDDGFTVRGVKIQRHSSTEQQVSSTIPITENSATRNDPLRHTAPINAWGNRTYTPQSQSQDFRQSTLNNTSIGLLHGSPPFQEEPVIPTPREEMRMGKDGKELLSVTVELDGDVMGFIKKIHKPAIKELELKHHVQISNRWGDEVMDVRITTDLSEHEGGQQKVENAKDEFIGFYQTVFYSVVKETVDYDVRKVAESEVDAVTTAVGKAFASRVYVSNRIPGEIVLVGSWDYLPLVKDWVNKKLVHTGALVHGNSKSKPQRGSKTSERQGSKNNREPVSNDTWVGQRPSKNKSRGSGGLHGSSTMPVKPSVEDGYVRSTAPPEYESSKVTDAKGSYYEHRTKEGVKVLIYKADITQVSTEVIVNASNESLHHVGTIAAAISDAAGPQLQQQCTAYVNSNGTLRVSEVMCTPSGGRLNCNHVIHAVGPMWCLFTKKKKVPTATLR